MTTPTSLPSFVKQEPVVADGAAWRASFRAMASKIAVVFGPGSAHPQTSFDQICEVFAQVETQCTRFDPGSDLMLANAAATDWHFVGPYCYAALAEAARAFEATGGRFDPRVLRRLQRLGYTASMPFGASDIDIDGEIDGDATGTDAVESSPWLPEFDSVRQMVRVGSRPVDLGGIGKGLAVRWSAQRIDAENPSFLIDAGGDCFARGAGPDGGPWRIAVEDPLGGEQPRAVLAITDAACVTSSIRLRRWRVAGTPVHHLIDPRTGAPGGAGLLAVTVVSSDPAEAEIWSKVLFLSGSERIADAARAHSAAALWVHNDGKLAMSEPMGPLVIWRDGS